MSRDLSTSSSSLHSLLIVTLSLILFTTSGQAGVVLTVNNDLAAVGGDKMTSQPKEAVPDAVNQTTRANVTSLVTVSSFDWSETNYSETSTSHQPTSVVRLIRQDNGPPSQNDGKKAQSCDKPLTVLTLLLSLATFYNLF